MSGFSLEGKAFLKSHKEFKGFLLQANLQHKTLISKAFYFRYSSSVAVNFVFLKPTNKASNYI